MKNHPSPDHPNPSHTTLRLSKSAMSYRENERHGKTTRGVFHFYGGVAVISSTNCPSPGPGEIPPRLDRLAFAHDDQAATARWSCDLDLRDRFITLTDYLQRLQLMRLGIVPQDASILP